MILIISHYIKTADCCLHWSLLQYSVPAQVFSDWDLGLLWSLKMFLGAPGKMGDQLLYLRFHVYFSSLQIVWLFFFKVEQNLLGTNCDEIGIGHVVENWVWMTLRQPLVSSGVCVLYLELRWSRARQWGPFVHRALESPALRWHWKPSTLPAWPQWTSPWVFRASKR